MKIPEFIRDQDLRNAYEQELRQAEPILQEFTQDEQNAWLLGLESGIWAIQKDRIRRYPWLYKIERLGKKWLSSLNTPKKP